MDRQAFDDRNGHAYGADGSINSKKALRCRVILMLCLFLSSFRDFSAVVRQFQHNVLVIVGDLEVAAVY